jgi:hypothetical protein
MKIDMLRARGIALPVGAVAMSAWLSVSNHCLLGAATPDKTPAAANCCPFHSHPAKPQPSKQTDGLPCCKTLRALPSVGLKSSAPAVVELTSTGFGSVWWVSALKPPVPTAAGSLDTGPPGAFSFAELVLQRSTLAHAPPIIA